MKCEFSEGCSVLKSTRLRELLGNVKEEYCNGSPQLCARYVERSKGNNVPILLMPDGSMCRRTKKTKSGIEMIVE